MGDPAPAQPEGAVRALAHRLHDRDRADRTAASRSNNPTDFSLLDARQAPSWHHLFGTTDQGSDIFSQVMLGARRSLILGAAAATARHRPRRHARDLRRLRGRRDRRDRQLPDEHLPGHPHDPAARRHLRLPESARDDDDDARPRAHALGVRGAHPPGTGAHARQPRLRPGGESGRRAEMANRLRRADAEHDQPDRRRVRARLLHRPPRRRRARVPRPRRHRARQLGDDALLGADELGRAAGRMVALPLPGDGTRADRDRARLPPRRDRRGQQPAAAPGRR